MAADGQSETKAGEFQVGMSIVETWKKRSSGQVYNLGGVPIQSHDLILVTHERDLVAGNSSGNGVPRVYGDYLAVVEYDVCLRHVGSRPKDGPETAQNIPLAGVGVNWG